MSVPSEALTQVYSGTSVFADFGFLRKICFGFCQSPQISSGFGADFAKETNKQRFLVV